MLSGKLLRSPRLLFDMFIFGCPMRLNPHTTPQSQKNGGFRADRR